MIFRPGMKNTFHRGFWIGRASRFLILGVMVAAGMSHPLAESPSQKILVVNSDRSVEKYNVALRSFRESFEGPVKEIDVSEISEEAARRMIRAETPSAIYSIGTKASVAASKATGSRPVVISSVINWNRLPAAKANGVHVIANEVPSVTQLTMFRYFFPKVRRIGVLYSREFNRQWMSDAVAAGRDLGIEVVGVAVRSTGSAQDELSRLLPKVDALWVASDPVVLANEEAVRRVFAAADDARKPSFTYSSAFAEFGPTLIVAPDVPTIGRQAAGILKSLKPGSPKEIQSPAGSEVTLNLRAVREYRLELNEEARDSVNRFIH